MIESGPYHKHNPPKMMWRMFLWITLMVQVQLLKGESIAEEIYQPNCREALGMHSGLIEDDAISASSSYDVPSVGPQNSRIRTEKAGGAWCPKSQIAHNVHEFLQIDLGQVKVVTLVETQGRFGNGQGQEYAQEYRLEYQRNESSPWIIFHDKLGNDKFKGNGNTYIAELREVKPPIIARKIRFVPYSRHPRTVCMRVEVYGCPWADGMTSYSMRQGDTRGTDLLLYDFRYDGDLKDGYLSGGMGQLTDLEEGISNFRLDQDGTGKKGYEWVGWKNDSFHSGPVEIVFNFDQVRNFSFVIVHCNNLFSKGVRVFRTVKLYFSSGGENYQAEPVAFDYMKDSLIEYARSVIIPIPHRIAKVIKMELHYASRWILISEVKFESEIVKEPVHFDELPATTTTTLPTTTLESTTTTSTTTSPTTSTESQKTSTASKTFTYDPKVIDDTVKVDLKKKGTSRMNMDNKSVSEESKKVTDSPDSNTIPKGAIIHPEPHDDGGMQEEHIGIIIGTLAALILLLFAIAVFIIIRNKRRKQQEAAYGTCEKQNMNNKNMDDLGKMAEVNGMLASYQMYADDTYENDTIQRLKMKEAMLNEDSPASPARLSSRKGSSATFKGLPSPNQSQRTMNSLSPSPIKLAPGDQGARSPSAGGHSPPQYPPPPIPPPPHLSDLLKAVDFKPIREDASSEVATNNSVTRPRNLVEFPRRNLVFVEKLGTGEFGDVHRCEAYLGSDQHLSKSLPVVVKVLRQNSDQFTRDNFLREAEILAGLKDPNIAIVIGMSTQSEPMFMIMEYSKHGDLNQFLRQRKAQNEAPANDDSVLSYGCQLHLSMQIASGMKYLESLNMVHRDLATRNCLVTHNYTVKISDIGASCVAYDNDYFRAEGRARLPIRWMAWEAVILGKFSSKSDVWSFAVTLWEILTLARDPPFLSMSDQQVISNCSHFFNNDPAQVYLPQPYLCPREIYDLMCECWNRDESMRPAFREIHMFLQRKNMGYAPTEDLYMKPWA